MVKEKLYWASSNFLERKNDNRLHKFHVLFGTLLLLQVNGKSFFVVVSFLGVLTSFADFLEFRLKHAFQCKATFFPKGSWYIKSTFY